MLLAGCATTEKSKYVMTTFPEVPIESQASVKIVVQSDELKPLTTKLAAAFTGCGYKVVDEGADYWFVLNGGSQYAAGTTQKIPGKEQRPLPDGGTKEVEAVPKTLNFASSAMNVSVAAYKTQGLVPLTYFEIPMYSGDNKVEGVRGEEAYRSKFSKDVVARISNAFLCKDSIQEINDLLPLAADANLRKAFKACIDEAAAKAAADPNAQTYAPNFEPFRDAYKNKLTYSFTNEAGEKFSFSPAKNLLPEICAAVNDGTYGDKYLPKGIPADKKISAEERLANYYLYLLAKEIVATHWKNAEMLRSVKDELLQILWTIDEDGLTKSIPLSLARVEYKIKNLEK